MLNKSGKPLPLPTHRAPSDDAPAASIAMPPVPPELAAAIERAAPILARREKILAVLAKAISPELLTRRHTAQSAIARVQASHQLGEASAAEVRAAQAALDAAENEYKASLGQHAALEKELLEQVPLLTTAAAEVAALASGYAATAVEALRTEYTHVAAQLGRLVLLGRLLEQTLHTPVDLPDPVACVVGDPPVAEDLGSAALVGKTCDDLTGAVSACEELRERQARQAARFRPVFDAGALYRVVRPITSGGRSFARDEIVTAGQIRLDLLERMYLARNIVMEQTA